MKETVLYGVTLWAVAAATSRAQITTSQYDNQRTGATLAEKVLTLRNVNAAQFGKLGAFKVDGAVYAQPLFIPSIEIPGKGSTTCSLLPRNTTACMRLTRSDRVNHPYGI